MAPKRQRHSESASLDSSDDEFQDGVQQRVGVIGVELSEGSLKSAM